MDILCLVVVSQWTITCPLLWDDYPTPLDVNGLDTLTTTTEEQQKYWLLAIQVAREASCIRSKAVVTLQQNNADTGQRRA